MASPYCDKFCAFATLDLCAEKCGQPKSNRRPSCPEGERRARQWSDLPDKTRKAYHGNWELKNAQEGYTKHLARANWASDELKSAAKAQMAKETGRSKICVPLDALQRLIAELDILTVLLQSQTLPTAIVEGPEASQLRPVAGRG